MGAYSPGIRKLKYLLIHLPPLTYNLSNLFPKHPWNQISIGWARVLLLPATILLTPFLVYLNHLSYDWSDEGTGLSIAIVISLSVVCSVLMVAGGRIAHGLIVAGLITFFLDIQFEWIEGAGLLAKYVWLGIAIGVFTMAFVMKEIFYLIATAIFTVFFVVHFGANSLARTFLPSSDFQNTPLIL